MARIESPAAARRRRNEGAATVLAALLVIGLLAALPIGRLLLAAIAPGGVFDPAALAERPARPAALRAAVHTLDTAFFGALVSLAIGGPFAFALALTDLPGRRALGFFFILPLMIAPQVTALAWLHLLGPSSALLGAVGLAPPPGSGNPIAGRGGIILLYGIQHAPIVFVTLRAGLAGLPRDLFEAAQAAGAGRLRALVTIVLPLLRPSLVAAAALAFISGIGNFGIPALLGMSSNYLTLTTLIYQRLASFGPAALPEATALAVPIAGLAIAGIIVQARALGRRSTRFSTGQPPRLRLGALRLPAALLACLVLVLILVLPAAALLAAALVPAFGVPLSPETATLRNFEEVLFSQAATARAFRNSFLLAGGAALILATMAIPLAVATERFSPRVRTLVRNLVELPYAIPGIVLAIACILLFLRPLPLIGSLYATAAIILVAYLMRFLALSLKPVSAAIGRIPRELDEAAAVSGARAPRRLLTITAPIALPAAVAGALLVFMSAFNELTVSALLWSGGNETLGVVLFSLDEAGLGNAAAAIATATLAVVVLLLAAVDRLGARLPAGTLPWR
ncbi:ABC transporter permease [Prosthecomicrobium pneumaticum]|uniref:Iron(III) transport system permease protein n=1 Tax=Prosthecomicrobium pneumaticum TaxID=81895 RepID=A0A7W9L1U6_9HYPH|nr:iron ABC transporter permease [Prosthecomicrobium pneumaticum]MBB5753009.1 iron(III) transport system permease protein [Prosthecomicrobium pneumaticum]